MTSIPHFAKGQGMLIGQSGAGAWHATWANLWHLSHLLAHSCESFFKVRQKYPSRRSFSIKDCPMAWFPHKPSWTSQSTFLASSSFRHRRSGIVYPRLYRISLLIVYLTTKFFSFLATSRCSSTVSRLRYSISGVIHEGDGVPLIMHTFALEMYALVNTSIGMIFSPSLSMLDAKSARASASAFASRRTCIISNHERGLRFFCIFSMYAIMLGSLVG